jgi:glycosyltransferase involved in cell wall biosynthesis
MVITLVADQALGYYKTGGLGTATTHLALALGRMGNDVEILYFGEVSDEPVAAEWTRLYTKAGVRVSPVPPYETPVEPVYFGRMRAIELALREREPDVAIVQDLGAPGYVALRLRKLGLAFERTLFVVYCHGSRQWIANMARKVRVLPGALAVSRLEQACVELSDVVVSPSAYMVEWMRDQGWRLPEETHVIPLVTRAAATGEAPPLPPAARNGAVHRVTFFGRLEERKGVRPFVAGVNALPPEMLRRVELEFLGRATSEITPQTIDGLLSDTARSVLRGVVYATDVDQQDALARLERPGTLAVIPSLEDNSPNVVYECLERRIPFLASSAGGTRELVAAEDRQRVFFEPTAAGVATALQRALRDGDTLRPAQAAFDPSVAVQRWAEVVAHRLGPIPSATSNGADWKIREPELADMLFRAQAAADADVVTCGVRVEGSEYLFGGNPGGLAVLSNDYGHIGLIRRGLENPATADWPLLTRLSLRGARIVSIPMPLVESPVPPATFDRTRSEALQVVAEFERALPQPFRALPRLAVGLSVDARHRATPVRAGFVRRALRAVLRRLR